MSRSSATSKLAVTERREKLESSSLSFAASASSSALLEAHDAVGAALETCAATAASKPTCALAAWDVPAAPEGCDAGGEE